MTFSPRSFPRLGRTLAAVFLGAVVAPAAFAQFALAVSPPRFELSGKPGTPMPPWTQLSNPDLAAVITYTRNSWGNKTGDVLQPAEIKAARP